MAATVAAAVAAMAAGAEEGVDFLLETAGVRQVTVARAAAWAAVGAEAAPAVAPQTWASPSSRLASSTDRAILRPPLPPPALLPTATESAARAAAKEAVETEAVKEAVEAEEAATEAAAGAAKEAVETEAVETEAAAEAKPVVGSAKENSGRASQISADRDGSSCANEDSAGRKDDWLSGVGWHMAGVGELCVRGAATFEGYHGKPHLTAQVHRNRWSSSSSRRSSRSSSTSPILGMFFKVDFCVRGAATFEGYHGKPHLTAQVKISLVIIYIYIYIYIYG